LNRHLKKKKDEKENDLIVNKLNKVKASVDIKCPESFNFYKTQFKKPKNYVNESKEYEARKNNQILVEKIINILSNPITKNSLKKIEPFKLKKEFFSQNKKWDLLDITQNNQHFSKRLKDKKSIYSSVDLERDYDKNQHYKKNLCVFPSISFQPQIESKNTENSTLFDKFKTSKIKLISTGEGFSTSSQINKNKENYNSSSNRNNRKILFNKNVFIKDLSYTNLSFVVEDKKYFKFKSQIFDRSRGS
jgi:hypothetical protein